ncbi:MAG: hypothetical protein EOP83_32620 [Verrucomicrobiaceae bacterium]|nr:MAG: hypothetical protein EOP83_32620 [Verrucomicrobiaceae bacterium]
MGGDIKMMTRFSDGTVEGDVRHTNLFPFWFRHPRFIEADEAWFRQYVEMPSEYKEGDNTFVPDEYGVVVADFQSRTVFVCNGYSNLVTVSVFEREHLESNQFGIGTSPAEDAATFREMLEKGYLCIVEHIDQTQRKTIDISGVTPETWDAEVNAKYGYRLRQDNDPYRSVGIKYPGWTFKHYDVCVAGHDQLRQDLLTAGFTFTPEDEAKYAEWRAERVELEAENS